MFQEKTLLIFHNFGLTTEFKKTKQNKTNKQTNLLSINPEFTLKFR